ncbi:MAG: NfeD family protein [Firmicutes bacterium]|nr:NfeD family protein [Bacillota bacterium]
MHMQMWEIWLIIAGICLLLEIFTTGILIFWFAIGALFAAATSFFADSLVIQTFVFVIVSTILLFLTRPMVNRYIKTKNVHTNAFAAINKKGIVTVDIDPTLSTGQVKIDGEIWTARAEKDTLITKGTNIEVVRIDGVKVIVKPIK